MRGADTFTESLYTMRHLEDFVPGDKVREPLQHIFNTGCSACSWWLVFHDLPPV